MPPKHFRCEEHIIPAQHIRTYYRATADSPEEELQIAVKQYIPLQNESPRPGDATVIAAHAAGFFKELYEPFFDDLWEASQRSNGRFRIRSIWIADMATHGKSGILNEGKLGSDLNYDDHARDLLQMVNTFRREMPTPIVGIGHSMGAGQLLSLALLHPNLFSTVMAIEPVITRGYNFMHLGAVNLLTFRPDIWPSRDAAAQAARKNILFKGWDERALNLFFQYGFREVPTLLYPQAPVPVLEKAKESGSTPVTFTTTKHHETRAYARPAYPAPGEPLSSFQPTRSTHPDLTKEEHDELKQPVYRPESVLTHRMLPLLRPSCTFVYAARSPFMGARPEGRLAKMQATGIAPGGSGGVAEGKVREISLSLGGHYVAFEHPKELAEEILPALNDALGVWMAEQQEQRGSWDTFGRREKAMLDDGWMWWVKEHYSKRKKQSKEKKPKL